MSNEVAEGADSIEHVSGMPQHTTLVFLDAGWTLFDLERFVGHLAHDADAAAPLLVVCQRPLRFRKIPARWSVVLVPNIARLAAAFGARSLPAVVSVGTMAETQQRIAAIVRWQELVDAGRASGAISSNELH